MSAWQRRTINNVNMNVNMSGIKISDANFSHVIIDHVQLFGTEFHNVVLPMEGDGKYHPDGQLRNCDLSNVEITDCDITGSKINGILISDLIKDK